MTTRTLAFTLLIAVAAATARAELSGTYIEARTCQVYTGPCFANGETGLAGQEAVLAWNIESGHHQGVDLAGLNVVMVIKADRTIGFRGLETAKSLGASVLLDERASPQQQKALAEFAREHVGLREEQLVRVASLPVEVKLDTAELNGSVQAGKDVHLTTRKARKDDCICSNESAYYPPIVSLENFAAGVTIDGSVRTRGLGSRWEVPGDRNVPSRHVRWFGAYRSVRQTWFLINLTCNFVSTCAKINAS